MKLIVHELVTSLYQEITVGDHPLDVGAIRAHLYIHQKSGFGGEILRMQIHDSNGGLVATSADLNVADLGSADYVHGFFRFLISAHLRAGETYRLVLTHDGSYSFNEAYYVGWVVDHVGFRYASYAARGKFDAPLDFEIWVNREFRRGAA